MQLTVLVHGRVEALGQATGATLIPVSLIHGATSLQIPRRFARINPISVDAALEKSTASWDEILLIIALAVSNILLFGFFNVNLTTYRRNCKCRNACPSFGRHTLCTECPRVYRL